MDTPLSPGLYIVATPIGNLGDITLRAVETLRGVSAVACEDTRVTGKLLHHLGIKQRLIRYDDHASEETRDPTPIAVRQSNGLRRAEPSTLYLPPAERAWRQASSDDKPTRRHSCNAWHSSHRN